MTQGHVVREIVEGKWGEGRRKKIVEMRKRKKEEKKVKNGDVKIFLK